jgi:hypothetical protein
MKTVKAEIGKTKGKFPERFFIVKVYIPVENGSSMKISFFNGKTKTEAKRNAEKAMKTLDYKVKFER